MLILHRRFHIIQFHTRFPSQEGRGAVALGRLEMPHGFQQPLIVLLAPPYGKIKQDLRCNRATCPRPWSSYGTHSFWCSSQQDLPRRSILVVLGLTFKWGKNVIHDDCKKEFEMHEVISENKTLLKQIISGNEYGNAWSGVGRGNRKSYHWCTKSTFLTPTPLLLWLSILQSVPTLKYF